MKRIMLLLLMLAFVLSGCSQPVDTADEFMKEWAAQANLTAKETPEELYAAALKEGTLIVYSTSTRMMDVAKSFEAQYPGLTVRVEDIRGSEMYDMLRKNFDSGNFACDVVCSADGWGETTNEFLPEGIVHKYVPYDIADKLLQGSDEDLLTFIGEASVLAYNDEYYDASPISNWWELTEEPWRGKVYMPNPFRSVTTFAFSSIFISNSDLMADAYEERYGTPPETEGGETAGEFFIRRLVENDVVIVNSSDEIAEAVAAPGSAGDRVGIMVTSKLRLRNIGYNLAIAENMAPFDGVYAPVNIMVAGGAKNVNAAKLFIRWILGETDGQGEGYKPYLQSGAWSMRIDVEDESKVAMDSLDLLEMDRAYLYKHKDEIFAFWENLIQTRK